MVDAGPAGPVDEQGRALPLWTGEEARAEAARVARDVFGYAELRDGQAEAIAAALGGRDVLLVMPTGAGKSAVYQVPAVSLPGPTLVVSPLIALQRDQAEGLSELGGLTAARAVSSAEGARAR